MPSRGARLHEGSADSSGGTLGFVAGVDAVAGVGAVGAAEIVTRTFFDAPGESRGAMPTPNVTPPPIRTPSDPAGAGSSRALLVPPAISGLVTVLGALTPGPARARRRGRRG